MRKIRVGWIGAGFVGQSAHLEEFIKFPNIEITCLADKRQELLQRVGSSFGIKQLYKDHLELLTEKNLDAVVAIVNRRHTFQVARDVLNAGFSLLTEKPMAQTHEDAKELLNISKQKNLTYSVGFMRRYDPGLRKLRDLLNDVNTYKKLGNIQAFRLVVDAGSDYCGIGPRISSAEEKPPAPPVRIAPKWLKPKFHREYESFVNVCSHDINILTFLFPKNPKIDYVSYNKSGVSYAFFDYGIFKGVFEWSFRKDLANGWNELLEIKFENGQIDITLPPAFLRNVSSEIRIRRNSSNQNAEIEEKLIKSDYVWSFTNSDKAFLASLSSKKDADHAAKKVINDFKIIDSIWDQIEKNGCTDN